MYKDTFFKNLYRSVNRDDPIQKWQDFCFECCLDAIFHFDYELSDNMDDPLNLIVSCADCLSGAFASERQFWSFPSFTRQYL